MTINPPNYETTSTHNYTKPYTDMKKFSARTVITGFALMILIALFLSFIAGIVVRGVVELFGWGYSFFGLW